MGEADEVELARDYCSRKRIQKPVEQKEVVRVMNRLMRAGYSSGAIFKLLRTWHIELPESARIQTHTPNGTTCRSSNYSLWAANRMALAFCCLAECQGRVRSPCLVPVAGRVPI